MRAKRSWAKMYAELEIENQLLKACASKSCDSDDCNSYVSGMCTCSDLRIKNGMCQSYTRNMSRLKERWKWVRGVDSVSNKSPKFLDKIRSGELDDDAQ